MSTIGVDVGGTKVSVAVLEDGELSEPSVEPTEKATADTLVDQLARRIEELRGPGTEAVGLGIPAAVEFSTGTAKSGVNVPLAGVPLRHVLTERLGLPVFVDNDANVAILAEHRFGAARGTRNAVMLTIGTGIGGGLIIDGQLYRGSTGAGAELGHTVIEADGPPCQGNCPNRGCVEALASGTAIAREGLAAAEGAPDSALGRAVADGVELDGKEVTDAALAGDETARGVLDLIGRRLGVAFSSLANIFDPDVIVIGGGASRAGELLAGPAREELASRALPPMNGTPVATAELGSDAGLIGAATMALVELDGGTH